MIHSIQKLWHSIGPITISVLSFFISYLFLSPFFTSLFYPLTLLDNRGIGKLLFSCMALYQVLLFIFCAAPKLYNRCITDSIQWLFTISGWRHYIYFFMIGFSAHAILLCIFYYLGYAQVAPSLLSLLTFSKVIQCCMAAFITFLLAWSEESLFRGFFYNYFLQNHSQFFSVVLTSFIFMFAHGLSMPWLLITTEWRLGLGLFLLGLVLNMLYIKTGSLAASMGFHAGLVSLKVFLRRIPYITILPSSSYLVSVDVRQSLFTQGMLLGLVIIILCLPQQSLEL